MLSSPLARAWRTAEILVEEATWPAPVDFEALEPEGSAAKIVEDLRQYSGRGSVAVVGHEPLLGQLIAFVVTGSDESGDFTLKKGGAACVEMAGDDTRLRWLLTPKIERALGS